MSDQHPVSEADQERVYELMREKLFDLFGPGGSFRITLGRATDDDAVFVSTVADTIAWDVAGALAAERPATAKRNAAPVIEIPEQNAVWQFVEQEVLRRRQHEDALAGQSIRAA